MLIFLHLPKTAGTTLARILERHYGEEAVLSLYDSSSGEELATIPETKRERLRVVMGHFSFGVHRFLPAPSPYITMLREPIDRVISHYYFVRREPAHYLHEAAQRLSLRDFVAACGAEEPNNDQTRLLAGDCRPAGSRARADELLAAAKQHLRDHFAVTGMSEDFDRSVVLMKRVFGWGTPFYARENVGKQRPPRGRIPGETLRVIQGYNQLDVDLYRYAQALLETQVRLHGVSLERELRRFKRLNYIYGRLYAPLRSGLLRTRAS